MKKFLKVFSFIFVAVLAFVLASCDGGNGGSSVSGLYKYDSIEISNNGKTYDFAELEEKYRRFNITNIETLTEDEQVEYGIYFGISFVCKSLADGSFYFKDNGKVYGFYDNEIHEEDPIEWKQNGSKVTLTGNGHVQEFTVNGAKLVLEQSMADLVGGEDATATVDEEMSALMGMSIKVTFIKADLPAGVKVPE